MSVLLLAGIPLALIMGALTWYARRQTRTHAEMRHTPLVEHHDTEET